MGQNILHYVILKKEVLFVILETSNISNHEYIFRPAVLLLGSLKPVWHLDERSALLGPTYLPPQVLKEQMVIMQPICS